MLAMFSGATIAAAYVEMRDGGARLAQGYLFGKPIPISGFSRSGARMLTALVA